MPGASEGELPIRFADDPDETLQKSFESYRAAAPLTAAHVADKVQLARGYDVLHMDRAVAILFWGRSGSLLLASYLDGHDETLVMPAMTSGGGEPQYLPFELRPYLRRRLLLVQPVLRRPLSHRARRVLRRRARAPSALRRA
jgi:hypothetical protein